MSTKRKKIVLLGATGSIGQNTLRIIANNREKLELIGVAAHSNIDELQKIARTHNVPHMCIFDEKAYQSLKSQEPKISHLHQGLEGLETLAALPEADLVVVAVVGAIGVHPTLAAIRAGTSVALANKEPLVLAGKFITEEAKKHNVQILPIDSEHNSIFQCIQGVPHKHISKVYLTASGGMFRDYTLAQMKSITPEQATKHPNWEMGAKVTVDTSTLINKGLELIEARWLFGLNPDQVDAVVHPQSIIHNIVTLVDGCMLAQINPPSMTFAIQHCLFYPERHPGVDKPLDLGQLIQLDLQPPDTRRFPGFAIAKEVLKSGGTAPAIFNAANEIAVEAFLQERISYLDICKTITETLNLFSIQEPKTLEDVLEADRQARTIASDIIHKSKILIPAS